MINRILQCEKCKQYYNLDGEYGSFEDYQNIDEKGMCISCEEEIDVKII